MHVTLTGVRGAFAPFLGMALYLGWDVKGYVPGSSGLGAWLFLVSALLGVVRGADSICCGARSGNNPFLLTRLGFKPALGT